MEPPAYGDTVPSPRNSTGDAWISTIGERESMSRVRCREGKPATDVGYP